MSQELWNSVDNYFNERLLGDDPALTHALSASSTAGLPAIQVSAAQGRLLTILALSLGAQRILEVGTLGGYSTICLARALPEGGRLITLEISAKHALVAQQNLAMAGLDDKVEVITGPASESLPWLQSRGEEPFDLTFIDADKPGNPLYVEWALKLSRPGSLIIVDNVVRGGAVVDAASTEDSVLGVRRMAEQIAAEPRLLATAIQTLGEKGYDGFLIARVQ